ncbi:FIST C-terminal domain-containing protein [bacterium]|nr:FIST C-terminal domain-containing protein [bacterium]
MPMQSAVGYSENIYESYEAGIEIGDMVLEKIDLQAHSVGILFCHVDFEFAELLRGIREKLDIPIVGCTTGNEANDQGYFEESASLMVISADDIRVGIGLGKDLAKSPETAVQKACASALANLEGEKPKLALTFPDTFFTLPTDHVLALLEQRLGSEVPVVGGLPGDDYQFKKTYQFCNDAVYSDSIPLLLISGNMEPLIITRTGWIPIGAKAKVTKSQGTVVYEIDHQPAFEYLKKYIGGDVEDPDILGAYPFALLDEALGEEAGRYCVIRAVFKSDSKNGSVTCNGFVPEGAAIQLARGSREDILAGSEDAVNTLKSRAGTRDLHGLLCFSCAGRKLMLGLETRKEIELILNALPDACAVNGFYSYGELGPIDSTVEKLKKSRFHNTTLVLCAF